MSARRRPLLTLVVSALVATLVAPAAPATAQEEPSGRDETGAEQALVSVDIDVLRADTADVNATLAEVRENVESQKAMLTEAEAAVETAQAELAAAEAALAETQARLDAVNVEVDLVVVDSFVNPPVESAFDALTAESLTEATVKQSILDRNAERNAATLDEYLALREQLEAEEAAREEAAAAAAAAEAEAEAALADVEAAVSQEVAFALEVERRVEQRLAEADALQDVDPALAEQIRAREAELAALLEELDEEVQAERARARSAELAAIAEANKGGTGIKPVPGGVTDVACPGGGVVQVAGDIAGQVERLLTDAYEEGISMCGYGYRDPSEQIAVRRRNCGTSYYAIYQAPSSYCSPPTARPGTSMHEQGLAIDFTSGGATIGYGSAGYNWLRANAANYGLYNLPGEPWHWSVDGN
ncbi:MAG TPA: M15 family metallopeptidase [Acidimicrobiales bacterium]|nr:M15 family metallopeptidase [Acidimicrobiales bacterium]